MSLQSAVQTDWTPRNNYTTPIIGIPDSNNSGIIKAVTQQGEKISVGRIDYQHFDDERYQYTITPFWDIIDGIGSVFQGIPGIKLELRLAHYYRVNYTPVFITERTPSPNREDLWELMESVSLDYYDRLEWLIRTDLRAGNDNLIVERWREKPIQLDYITCKDKKTLLKMLQYGDTVTVNKLDDLSDTASGFTDMLRQLMFIGVDILCRTDGISISVQDRTALLVVLNVQHRLSAAFRKRQQTKGIDRAKQAGKYRGRKKLPINELQFLSAYERLKTRQITLPDAMRESGISSRSTFYRRMREHEKQVSS